jgi:pimeloyl-ACP methyl ester carboxylesterase
VIIAPGYTDDLRQLTLKVGLKETALVGYSHGGYFTVDFALTHPKQVTALVLIEPALFIDRSMLAERIRLVTAGQGDAAIKLLVNQIAPDLALEPKVQQHLIAAISNLGIRGTATAPNSRIGREPLHWSERCTRVRNLRSSLPLSARALLKSEAGDEPLDVGRL